MSGKTRSCYDCGKLKCGCEDRVDGFIYFVLATRVNRVKIGYTKDMKQRFDRLQYLAPVALEVIKVWRGSFKLERQIHDRFYKYRRHGEWFELTQELLTFIESLPNKHRLRASDIPNFE
jgi:hypothetical protein